MYARKLLSKDPPLSELEMWTQNKKCDGEKKRRR